MGEWSIPGLPQVQEAVDSLRGRFEHLAESASHWFDGMGEPAPTNVADSEFHGNELPENFDPSRAAKEFAAAFPAAPERAESDLETHPADCGELEARLRRTSERLATMDKWITPAPAEGTSSSSAPEAALQAVDSVFKALAKNHPESISEWGRNLEGRVALTRECMQPAFGEAQLAHAAELVDMLSGPGLAQHVYKNWRTELLARDALLKAMDDAVARGVPGAMDKREDFIATLVTDPFIESFLPSSVLGELSTEAAVKALSNPAFPGALNGEAFGQYLATRSPEDFERILSADDVAAKLSPVERGWIVSRQLRGISSMAPPALERLVSVMFPPDARPAPPVVSAALGRALDGYSPATRAPLEELLRVAANASLLPQAGDVRDLQARVHGLGAQAFSEVFASLAPDTRQVLIERLDYAALAANNAWGKQATSTFIASPAFAHTLEGCPDDDKAEMARKLSTVLPETSLRIANFDPMIEQEIKELIALQPAE